MWKVLQEAEIFSYDSQIDEVSYNTSISDLDQFEYS